MEQVRTQDSGQLLGAVGRAYRRECRGRRLHPFVVRIGRFGGPHTVVPHHLATDAGLRVDLLERLLAEQDTTPTDGWITRGGALAPGDADFAWFTATRTAFARHGLLLGTFYVLTREGWLDLNTDQSALWRPRPEPS